ncbi:MAG: LCP family protein [Clostridia bacterium]|nr:LCP family protein [Clostridia bacterium]
MEKKRMKSKEEQIYSYNGYDEDFEEKRRVPKKGGKRVAQKKKKKKKKRIFLRILLVLLIIIGLLVAVVYGYVQDKFNKVEYDDSFNKDDIEINEGVQTTGYMNILLFGVDARDQNESYTESLSDVIMIVSINQDTKKVKIASVYRDTYLQDPVTKKCDKVTHAFLKGGPSRSINTINTNLDLDIKEYVAINFNVVIDLVDAVGGIELDISKEEAKHMKNYITEMNNCTGHKSKYITTPGVQLVDGIQATAYARQRYTGTGDWERTERQREVLNKVFEKIKTTNLSNLNKIADTVLSQISTNIEKKQILYLLTQAASYEVEETVGWPEEVGDYWVYEPMKIWYGAPINLEKQVIKLHEYLFGKVDYQVSPTVKAISDKIIKETGLK